jgi:hypothetical protein
MKFNAYEFIERAQQKINQFRRRALISKLFGNVIACVVFAVMATLFIQMLLRGLYSLGTPGAQRGAIIGWNFFDNYVHLLWAVVLSLPFPKTLPRANQSMMPLIFTLAFYVGAMFACGALRWRGTKLRMIADKAQQTLDLQAPLLMQLEANGASIVVGPITGDGNHIASHNPVTRVIKEGEKQSKSWLVISAIAVPVIIWLLNHYLHVT